MKKFSLLLTLISLTLTTITFAQGQFYYPSKVKFIAGGYTNKTPFFNTLEAALNNVKALATAEDPYVFWVSGDTLRIADWDSVFTESGLTMKDSIEQYYVSTGKIKWAGFGFGGTGGTVTIIAQDGVTLHYEFPNWDQLNMALSLWQRLMGKALDSIDQRIWDLIVYVNPDSGLFIENDTLHIDLDLLADSLVNYGLATAATAGWYPSDESGDPDTTTVGRTYGNQTIAGNKTYTGTQAGSGNGYFKMNATQPSGVSRVFWSDNDSLWYSLNGTDTIVVADKGWVDDNYVLKSGSAQITYTNLAPAVVDSINDSKSYGNIYYVGAGIVVTTTVEGNPYPIQGCSTGEKRNVTNTDSSITVTSDGIYEIMFSGSIVLSSATPTFHVHIHVDNVEQDPGGTEINVGAVTDIVPLNGQCLLELSANDVIEIKVERAGGASSTATFTHFSLSVMKID